MNKKEVAAIISLEAKNKEITALLFTITENHISASKGRLTRKCHALAASALAAENALKTFLAILKT